MNALLLQIALRIGGLSLVAVGGGNALIPALHETAVRSQHWIDEGRFAEAVGLSQAAPGPNMLLMPLIGWQVAGIPGALVALLAFLVPSITLAVLGSRLLTAYASTPFVAAFKWALRPVAGGLMLAAGVVLAITAARTWPGASAAAAPAFALLAAAVAAISVRVNVNPLVWLAAAALAGALIA